MSYKYIDPGIHKLIVADTRPYKEIAKDYNVHKDTVGRIKRQALWEQASNGSNIQEVRTVKVTRSLARLEQPKKV